MKAFSSFYLPVDHFNDVCRVCLSKHKVLIPIEEISFTHNLKANGLIDNIKLNAVFLMFCKEEVDASDNKPQKICEFCIDMACKAFNFFQLFLYSNSLLNKKLEEVRLSQEPELNESGQSIPDVSAGVVAQTKCPSLNATSIEVTSEDVKSNNTVLASVSQNMNCTDTRNRKRKYINKRQRQTPPPSWLEPNGAMDPIKERALNLLLKISNKIQPVKPAKRMSRSSLRRIENLNEIFRCQLCSQVFHNITKVIKHLRDEHADTKRCILCSKRFSRTQWLLYHVAAHSQNALVCRICQLYFENEENLNFHKENIDHTNTRKCPKCEKTFKSPFFVRNHFETVHVKKANYQCKICGKMFRYFGNVKRHEKNTHGNTRFLCQRCGKSFSTLYQLKVHMQKIHKVNQGLNIREYPRNQHSAKRGWGHPRPKIMKFECQFCPQKFPHKHGFFMHSDLHPEFKNYDCDVCSEVSETYKGYLNHRKTHEKFQCPFPSCDKLFTTQNAATLHKHTHKKSFRCTVCSRSFGGRSMLDCHMNIHTGARPFKCSTCGKGFKQRTHLDVHVISMHGGKKQWQCKLCDMAFSYRSGLTNHMRSHRGEKPFPCPFCKKMFRDTTGRHKHVKSDHPTKMEEFLVYKERYQDEEMRRIELESEKIQSEPDAESESED